MSRKRTRDYQRSEAHERLARELGQMYECDAFLTSVLPPITEQTAKADMVVIGVVLKHAQEFEPVSTDANCCYVRFGITLSQFLQLQQFSDFVKLPPNHIQLHSYDPFTNSFRKSRQQLGVMCGSGRRGIQTILNTQHICRFSSCYMFGYSGCKSLVTANALHKRIMGTLCCRLPCVVVCFALSFVKLRLCMGLHGSADQAPEAIEAAREFQMEPDIKNISKRVEIGDLGDVLGESPAAADKQDVRFDIRKACYMMGIACEARRGCSMFGSTHLKYVDVDLIQKGRDDMRKMYRETFNDDDM